MALSICDTRSVAPERQFDAFYDTVNSRLLRITPAPWQNRTAGFPARIVLFEGPGGRSHLIEAPGHSAHHTRHDIRPSDPDELHLALIIRGRRHVRVGEREFTARRGDAFGLDPRHPFDLIGARESYRSVHVTVPRRAGRGQATRRVLADPDALRRHPLHAMLRATCGCLGASLDRADDGEIPVLSSVAAWLFTTILRDARAEAPPDPDEIFLLITLGIERDLAEPEFGLDRLCKAIGMSPRSVQRILARRGTTFSALLRRKRMEQARRRLEAGHDSIETVALESGYCGLSAFYRAFRREFGISPGAVARPRAPSVAMAGEG